jgi:hypothetical protein
MLQGAGLGRHYWDEVTMTAIYLKNRSPRTVVKRATSEEIWSGSKVDLSHLRVFGRKAYALIPDKDRSKIGSKAKLYFMLGYCDRTKGSTLADLERPGKVKVAHNMEFIEHKMDMLNVRKESPGTEGKNPSVYVPFMNITPVSIVNVNEKAAENHTERDSSFDESSITVDSDSQHQTVSEKCESEITRSPQNVLHLNVSPGTCNSVFLRKLLLMLWSI